LKSQNWKKKLILNYRNFDSKLEIFTKFSKCESWAKLELFLIGKLETFDNKLENFTNY
jgi:hypothetical protein